MKLIMKARLLLVIWGVALLSAGCSEEAKTPAKKAEKAVEPVTGQTALYRMYQVARSWAPDAMVLKVNSIHLTDVAAVVGKAGAWQAVFTSSALNTARTYTYSVAEEEGNLHQGVFPGPQESWSGPADTAFLIGAVKVDTDAAYKTALGQAGDAQKKDPKQTISFLLERGEGLTNPAWRVIWGESVGTSGFSVLVDASTGVYLKTLH